MKNLVVTSIVSTILLVACSSSQQAQIQESGSGGHLDRVGSVTATTAAPTAAPVCTCPPAASSAASVTTVTTTNSTDTTNLAGTTTNTTATSGQKTTTNSQITDSVTQARTVNNVQVAK